MEFFIPRGEWGLWGRWVRLGAVRRQAGAEVVDTTHLTPAQVAQRVAKAVET
ncbi:hypothetical protein NKH77_50265 [Streptomyces sp. M19]